MEFQIYIDRNIDENDSLIAYIKRTVRSALNRIHIHIRSVEVHLSAEDRYRSSQNDGRCRMTVRFEGHLPIAVSYQAKTLHQAIDGATDKLTGLIESTLGRKRHKREKNTVPLPLKSKW